MRRVLALAVVASMTLSAAPLFAARAAGGAQAQTGTMSGTARNSTGQTVPSVTVQVRDLATGQLVGTTTSSATGAFSFTGLPAGNFAVEVVNAGGQIIGTSTPVAVAAGATLTDVTVTTTAAVGRAAAAGAASGSGVSTALVVTGVAVAAGVVAVIAVKKHNASGSR